MRYGGRLLPTVSLPNRGGTTLSDLRGAWWITWTDLWGEEDLDLLGDPEIVFDRGGVGTLRVGALEAELDYRIGKGAEPPRVDFSWAGFDDMSPVSGRGWAELEGSSLGGELFIHLGDVAAFRAVRATATKGE